MRRRLEQRHSALWKRAARAERRAPAARPPGRDRGDGRAAIAPCAIAAGAAEARAVADGEDLGRLVRPSASVSVSIEPLPRGTKRWAQPSERASSLDDEAKP
jgi:hypothetical protein